MNIQVYKPHFDVRFRFPDDSFTMINPEVINFIEILRNLGNQVQMMSPSDDNFKLSKPADIKVLFNGRLYFKGDLGDQRVDKEISEVYELFDNTTPQYHVITDWKIAERNKLVLHDLEMLDLTQSASEGIDCHLEKMLLYNSGVTHNPNKLSTVVYIGNKRGGARDEALSKFFELSGVPLHLYGNWDKNQYPNSRGQLLYSDTQQVLSMYKYGICLTEDLYVEKQHRTPRIWEYIRSDVIPFIDKDYPQDVFNSNDFRIVENGLELRKKIQFLKKYNGIYKALLRDQQDLMNENLLTGSYVGSKLNEVFGRFDGGEEE